MSEFYGDGTALPEMHPDPIINRDVIIAALCANLDQARVVLGRVVEMDFITDKGLSLKAAARHAIKETSPAGIGEQHPNVG